MLLYTCTLVLLVSLHLADSYHDDSVGAAITVYRNPDFFGHGFGSNHLPEDEYKYPGEPKKPNAKPPALFPVTFDNSPEFNHGQRDVFHDPTFKPTKGRGPYGHPRFEIPFPRLEDESFENAELADEGEPLQEDDEDNASYEEEDNSNLEDEDERLEEESAELESEEESADLEDEEEDGSKRYEDIVIRPLEGLEKRKNSELEDEVDLKPGTREYLKYYRPAGISEAQDLTSSKVYSPALKSGSKLVFKKVFIPKKIKPAFILSFKNRPRKTKFVLKVPSLFGRRHSRQVPDDSSYELNSEYDQDYETVTNPLRPQP